MARKLVGIRRRRNGWQAHIRIRGTEYTKQFPLDTPITEMLVWREDQREKYDGVVPAANSFGADIDTYLARVSSMPTYKQRAAHLALWAQALGRQRARRTITTAEIELVIQEWLSAGLDPQTCRKRRTSLQSLFVKLDGKQAKNPVKGASADQLKPPKAEARGLDYLTIGRILDAMPDRLSAKPGSDRGPALAKLRVAVLAHTGLPPKLLASVGPTDLQLGVGTVRVHGRRKGRGTEPRTLPLTPDGLAAFKAFHAANAYGKFAVSSLNVSFKRAAKKAGLDPTTVHLYDLRHSFGMELYRVTRDLATCARFLGHAPGSPITARYTQGANAAVDLAAAQAFGTSLALQRQQAMKAAPGQKQQPVTDLPVPTATAESDRADNTRKRKYLRAVK